ncbi:MAG TPA: serine/threonine-protein kinase [Polyangia bacterium]|nr:serine/threonine-protein kinase [Polyangia bacterium]
MPDDRGRTARLGFLLGVGTLLLVGGSAAWAQRRLRLEVRRQTADDLRAVLDTAVRGVSAFLDGAEGLASVVAGTREVRAAARGDGTFAGALDPVLHGGQVTGYLVVDARGIVVEASAGLPAAGRPAPDGVLPFDPRAATRKLPATGPPFRDGAGRLRLVVAAAVPQSPLVLGLALDANRLSAPLLAARAGATGETYGVDGAGVMISSSRFPAQLKEVGLLGPGEDDSALRLELRDPGGDLLRGFRSQGVRREQPLTHAAARVSSGLDGLSVEPYRDYRGVDVVGAWTWLPARGFGVITEVDAAEAFQPLDVLERVFGALIALLALAVAGTAAGILSVSRAHRRAVHAERDVRRLGEYVIERKIGSGAMGDVYLASHAFLRRPTALKLLRSGDRVALERFEREVQVTASLTHPNTVAIYDYGRSVDGTFYYAMEFLDGVDLERFLQRFGPISDARAVHILRQIYGALTEAHARNLVHRDIKPANVILCRRGGVPDLVKVVDFGLARVSGSATRGSVVVGTPENMAPELFESAEKATPASDLYAVGCVGYALITGRPVFDGVSLAELCNAHLSRTPVPPSERAGRPVDSLLERLILASLAKDPTRRPRSARDILAMLERSPLANAWTAAQANAFWDERGDHVAPDPEPAGGAEPIGSLAVGPR